MPFSHRLKQAVVAAVAVVSVYSVSAVAQEAAGSGEVRRIDHEQGKITIKQGAIPELQLPAMTLVYHTDPAALKDLKPGDTVTFTAKRENDRYVASQIKK